MSLDCDQMLAVLNALPDPVFVLTESGQYAGLFGHADPAHYGAFRCYYHALANHQPPTTNHQPPTTNAA